MYIVLLDFFFYCIKSSTHLGTNLVNNFLSKTYGSVLPLEKPLLLWP